MNTAETSAPPSPEGAPLAPGMRMWSPVRVVEVTAETDVGALPDLPLHLAGGPGSVAMQLRTTMRRVVMGAGLARNERLVEEVRTIAGAAGVVTSPVGGTFIVGGDGWMGLCAVGVPPIDHGLPLDWMCDSLDRWLTSALVQFGLHPATGKIEGAWCPGFSDVSVGGRKLIGVGYRVTRDWVVMRGVMPVSPMSAADHELLIACHRLIGVDVRPEASTSLAEVTGYPDLDTDTVIRQWHHVATPGGSRAI